MAVASWYVLDCPSLQTAATNPGDIGYRARYSYDRKTWFSVTDTSFDVNSGVLSIAMTPEASTVYRPLPRPPRSSAWEHACLSFRRPGSTLAYRTVISLDSTIVWCEHICYMQRVLSGPFGGAGQWPTTSPTPSRPTPTSSRAAPRPAAQSR